MMINNLLLSICYLTLVLCHAAQSSEGQRPRPRLVTWTPIINYFGTAFSPYVMNPNPDGSYPWWNSYTVADIEQMLNITLTYHNLISTYSMGVNQWNVNSPFDQCDSNGLVARAAANVNVKRARKNPAGSFLSVSLGAYQNWDSAQQAAEIRNVFAAAADANAIYAGTVWGITLTNEYVVDTSSAQTVLGMIQGNKARAKNSGLLLGTRIHTCWAVRDGAADYTPLLQQIVLASDFVMCNIYPGPGMTNVSAAVGTVAYQYFEAATVMKRLNPAVQVMIGETGWPSSGRSFNNDAGANSVANEVAFWSQMRNWARVNQVKVHMFEAFDEPWKGPGSGLEGESHYGWWYRPNNSQPLYVEKATGKTFQ